MKLTHLALLSALVLAGCASPTEDSDDSAQALFEENSKTVMAALEAFQNETLDHDSFYSEEFMLIPTGQGSPDSASLDDLKKIDQRNWEALDFKLLTDPVSLLPGVSADSKQPDGSIRFYGAWEVSVPATDSTEGKSAIIKMYHSYDFDENGKIAVQQGYGDFGGLTRVLFEEDDEEEETDTED